MMKKLFATLCIAVCGLAGLAPAAGAQVRDMLAIANHLGATVGVGTTGIGLELATPVTPFLQVRAGASFMPDIKFHVNSHVALDPMVNHEPINADVRVNSSLKRVQGSVIFNVYPLGNRFPFFIAVGGYFGGREMVKINGYCPQVADAPVGRPDLYGVAIGDHILPFDENGYARGALRVNSFRPYIGVGTGRPCPVGRLNFMWELGLQIQGKPYVWDEIGQQKIGLESFSNDDTYQKIINKVKVYPVLKFTLSGRIF